MTFAAWIQKIDQLVWGPFMLVLLTGTGLFLTIRTGFLPWRNLPYALKTALGREARVGSRRPGEVSPFSALMTTLAATIGTGNIVGIATALTAGGPGALVWMELSALVGLSSKFSECMLAVKFREINTRGEPVGGPMYAMKNGLKGRKAGIWLGSLFALFTAIASFGIGSMTQANSIAVCLHGVFDVSPFITGTILTVCTLIVILGGIQAISRISSVLVPVMAVFYLLSGLAVILGNLSAVPDAVFSIFKMAFSPKAVSGGIAGSAAASMLDAARYGIARGCFSNESGLGAAAITAAAATSDHPVKQGYINMTATFFDTMIICTITGLAICSSGMLGAVDPVTGAPVDGAALTMLAFRTVLGETGAVLVAISIALFAFSTILGWEYNGEKSFEFLFGTRRISLYRITYACSAYLGATQDLSLIWNISDIFNALMALPNLLSLLLLSGIVAREIRSFQPRIRRQHRI